MPYLFRRRGRFHFQMSVGAALESCSRISHVRCALRTGDRREASKRLITAMDWGYEFKEAPDLEDLGAALVRKLEPLVAAGPPTQLDTLKDRFVVKRRRTKPRSSPGWPSRSPIIAACSPCWT